MLFRIEIGIGGCVAKCFPTYLDGNPNKTYGDRHLRICRRAHAMLSVQLMLCCPNSSDFRMCLLDAYLAGFQDVWWNVDRPVACRRSPLKCPLLGTISSSSNSSWPGCDEIVDRRSREICSLSGGARTEKWEPLTLVR